MSLMLFKCEICLKIFKDEFDLVVSIVSFLSSNSANVFTEISGSLKFNSLK